VIDANRPTPAGGDRPARRRLRVGDSFRELGIGITLIFLCAFFWWRNPGVFTKPANLPVIMRFIATFGLLGIGEILVIITGGIDLSVGSMTALTGVLVAWLMLKGVGGITFGMIPAIVVVLRPGRKVGDLSVGGTSLTEIREKVVARIVGAVDDFAPIQ
jgi:ribose/xylose/arabinose/galactoside ABC-type transport system permease subunit